MEPNTKTNKIVAHFCGGAAINVSDSVFTTIAGLGDGFCDIEFNYIDTSTANFDKIQPKGDLFLVKSKQLDKTDIRGSGGETGEHFQDLIDNVKGYLDKLGIKERKADEFHLVVFSGSGGSGRGAGGLIISHLLQRNIPVVALVIGDSSNGLYAINTLNILASLNNIAVKNKKPLVISYVNNHSLYNNSMQEAEKAANQVILNNMSTLSLFLSGRHESLDNQDLINIIDQSNYRSIDIPAGLYGLHFYSKDVSLPKGAEPTVGRSLAAANQDFDTKVKLAHHKKGIIDSENALKVMGDQLPIHMLVYANFFAIEEEILKPITEDYYASLDKIKNREIAGTSRSKVDNDTGFVM